MLTIEQIRAARALLDWSQSDLADHASLSQTGIARIENGTNKPNSKTLEKIMTAFDNADIEFIGTTGVKKRTGEVRTLTGFDGFKTFIYDVYETTAKFGGQIDVSNVNEKDFDYWQGENRDDYLSKMYDLSQKVDFTFKILLKEGDEHQVAKYAEYKYLQEEYFGSAPFYVYGNKLALILFDEVVSVHIIENKQIAEAQRKQFNIIWDVAKSA